ncbi:MAG: response regulator [Polyangiaceae bacterium]
MAGPGRGAGQEILVVDDDPAFREVLVAVLSAEGYRVSVAEDGHQALQSLALRADDPPSLILLDLAMPVMSGQAFLEAHTAAAFLPAVPVIVLSGNLEGQPRRPDGHVIVYFRKPIHLERLLEAIQLWAR